jgi:hypothetical protein
MNTFKHSILIFICLLATGCANTASKQNVQQSTIKTPCETPANDEAANASAKIVDGNDLIAFADQYSGLPLEAQKQVLNNTNQVLSVLPSDLLQRFKLAMIYGLPTSHLQDTPKALLILQTISQEKKISNSQLAFANLLLSYVNAQNKANKNNRDDEKRIDSILQKNENLQNKLDSYQLKLDASQQKLDIAQQKLIAAQQKIDELKNIEKSMGQRGISK